MGPTKTRPARPAGKKSSPHPPHSKGWDVLNRPCKGPCCEDPGDSYSFVFQCCGTSVVMKRDGAAGWGADPELEMINLDQVDTCSSMSMSLSPREDSPPVNAIQEARVYRQSWGVLEVPTPTARIPKPPSHTSQASSDTVVSPTSLGYSFHKQKGRPWSSGAPLSSSYLRSPSSPTESTRSTSPVGLPEIAESVDSPRRIGVRSESSFLFNSSVQNSIRHAPVRKARRKSYNFRTMETRYRVGALTIQCCWRSYCARQERRRRAEAVNKVLAAEEIDARMEAGGVTWVAGALVIQMWFRRIVSQRELARRRSSTVGRPPLPTKRIHKPSLS
eukprot:Sspe_Gene.64137::Locus_37542_Transcript_1_1_Confidence_1.000_Length_1101::g.64137::m.64137